MPRRIISTFRRYLKTDRLFFFGLIIMRVYSYYRIHNFFYVITPESSYCKRCFRSHLKCELTPFNAKAERLFKKEKRLTFEIITAYVKFTRLRKQYRIVIKKLRDLGSRENQNILKFKINEIMANIVEKIFFSGIFNFFSSQSFSFLDLTFLNFSGKIAKMS
jgi:hypothetical protein